jgi:L-ascorbate metabolism protein UlaG (beta-lactamase superfamily)
MHPRSAFLLAALVLGGTPARVVSQASAPRRDSLTITYLANEGVMLSSGGTTVLIDALFGDGLRGYGVVSPARRERLERAQPPFERIAAILATHTHRDHFDPRAVARHLAANPQTLFVSTAEAMEALRGTAATSATARLHPVVLAPGERQRVTSAGSATIWALGLPHGPDQPANLGFVVDIGGRRVLHVGDSEPHANQFTALRLSELGIDVALLTTAYLAAPERRDLVRQFIQPAEIGVIHVPPRESRYWGPREEQTVALVTKEFPRARIFRQEMEVMVVR